MQSKRKLGVALSVAAVAVAATWAAVGLSGPADAAVATGQVTAAAPTGPGGTWGPAQPVPGLSALAPSGTLAGAGINAISCATPGNCAAVGSYVAGTGNISRPFVVTETDGTWGNAQRVSSASVIATSNTASLTNVSCGAPGDCTATGEYTGTGGVPHAILVTETSGVWGTATAIDDSALGTGADIQIASVSCSAAGECAAVGSYTVTAGAHQAFVMDESSGKWGPAEPVTGQASLQPPADQSNLSSVSCAAPGDCTAAGSYSYGSSGDDDAPLLVTEVNHNWGNAKPVPGFSNVAGQGTQVNGELDSISCREATACTAVGMYTEPGVRGYAVNVFTVDEANASWQNAKKLSIPGSFLSLSEISCSSAGNCAITGTATWSSSLNPEIFAATESGHGNWGNGQPISGIPAGYESLSAAVSCAPGGDCTVVGDYYLTPSGLTGDQAFTATGSPGGSFGAAHLLPSPGIPITSGPDCTQTGYCVLSAASPGTGTAGLPVLLTEATAATVTLKAAKPAVTYGAEQAETLTATVTSPAGGTPSGTVTVTDITTPVCTIKLVNRTGNCTLTAKALPGGTPMLTATYSGDTTYVPATATAIVTVARAATVTRLAFTPRNITFTGAATTLTVTGSVSSTAGTPNGWVTVRVDGKAVAGCINVPFTGTVSCKGTTAILAGGKHLVALAYSGRGDFAASTSASLPLTVAKRGTTTTLALAKTSVTYGHENAEKLTVSVSRVGSVYATGKVTIKAGTITLCTITLSKGAGICTLSTTKLKPGTYHLTATYSGDTNYAPSTSASKTLKVAP